jgi:hypothetical protein
MNRRALLQSLWTIVAVGPFARLYAASAGTPADLSDADVASLRALAEVTLPASLGDAGRDQAVARFVEWIRAYREGADRGHSYGASILSAPTGPSPVARYPPQFDALSTAAKTEGAASFAAAPLEARRRIVLAALDGSPKVTAFPARPTGASLIADFMGHFFNSDDAWDLAYQAAIGRDRCRSLDGSERAPAPLGSR